MNTKLLQGWRLLSLYIFIVNSANYALVLYTVHSTHYTSFLIILKLLFKTVLYISKMLNPVHTSFQYLITFHGKVFILFNKVLEI